MKNAELVARIRKEVAEAKKGEEVRELIKKYMEDLTDAELEVFVSPFVDNDENCGIWAK